MGKYSSDVSDDDPRKLKKRKKKKARSRSRSSSDSERHSSSARHKKSKRKHRRSRSKSSDRRHRGRSRSPNRGRSYSRSRSRERRRRSPSYSRSRRSHSRERRSRSRDRRSRSRSADRYSSKRSSPRDRRYSRSPSQKSRQSEHESYDPKFLQNLQTEQAEEKIRSSLKAAALADEYLRTKMAGASMDVLDRQDFHSSVAAIEDDGFINSAFLSSRGAKIKDEGPKANSHDDAIFGSLSVTGFTLKADPDTKPVDLSADSIIHPSLYCDPEDKMDRWMQRLATLRRRKLEGEAM